MDGKIPQIMGELKKDFFSVIVCCYNPSVEKLKKTIVSIEKQQNVSFEVIISDDGSYNSYEEEIKKWALKKNFKNIIYAFSNKNRGTVANILSGLAISKGEYSKVISPGDFFFSKDSLSQYLNTFKRKNADMVYSKGRYYTPNGKIIKSRSQSSWFSTRSCLMKKNICIYGDCILGASIACKTKLEQEYLNKIVDKIKYVEDYSLSSLLLLDKKKVVFKDAYLVWYEFGLGLSTKTQKYQNPLLSKDFNSFYTYLSNNYSNRFIKKLILFKKAEKIKGKIPRFFHRCLISPGFFFFKLSMPFHLPRKPTKKEYNQLSSITEGWE